MSYRLAWADIISSGPNLGEVHLDMNQQTEKVVNNRSPKAAATVHIDNISVATLGAFVVMTRTITWQEPA